MIKCYLVIGSQGRNSVVIQEQELQQRAQRSAVHWLVPHDLLSLLSKECYSVFLGMALPHLAGPSHMNH